MAFYLKTSVWKWHFTWISRLKNGILPEYLGWKMAFYLNISVGKRHFTWISRFEKSIVAQIHREKLHYALISRMESGILPEFMVKNGIWSPNLRKAIAVSWHDWKNENTYSARKVFLQKLRREDTNRDLYIRANLSQGGAISQSIDLVNLDAPVFKGTVHERTIAMELRRQFHETFYNFFFHK